MTVLRYIDPLVLIAGFLKHEYYLLTNEFTDWLVVDEGFLKYLEP